LVGNQQSFEDFSQNVLPFLGRNFEKKVVSGQLKPASDGQFKTGHLK